MKRVTILILCVALVSLVTSCRPERTTRDKKSGAETTAMTPTQARPMAPSEAMDYSLPPDMNRAAPQPRPGPMGPPGDLKAALADLDRVLVLQKQVVKTWQSVNTVADAQRRKAALLKGALDVLAVTIAYMKKAVTLSAADLAIFLQKQQQQRVHTRRLNEAVKAKQRQLMALPGGKAFYEALKKSATVEVRRRSTALMTLGRKLLARQQELKR